MRGLQDTLTLAPCGCLSSGCTCWSPGEELSELLRTFLPQLPAPPASPLPRDKPPRLPALPHSRLEAAASLQGGAGGLGRMERVETVLPGEAPHDGGKGQPGRFLLRFQFGKMLEHKMYHFNHSFFLMLTYI